MRNTFRTYRSDVAAILLLIGLSIFFYHKTISFWPSHIHAWTQGDRYALAIKFSETGLNLFKPRTFNLQTREGITAVDLPVHDYAVGVIMRITGNEAPLVFRVYTLLFAIAGCLGLFRLAKLAGNSPFTALVVAVFVFTCPVIVYYQTGFIPSATSFSLTLIGYYCYFKYLKTGSYRDFYTALGLFTVAALSRSPFNIFLFATLLQQMLTWARQRKVDRGQMLGYATAYAVIAIANLYKWWLAEQYGSQFLGELRPAPDLATFLEITGSVLERWTFQVFSNGHYFILAVAIISLCFRLIRKQTDALQRQITFQGIIALAGGSIYYVLMARQFVDHEYYFMDSLYPGLILLLTAGMACLPSGSKPVRIGLWLILALCLVWAAMASKKVQEVKYSDKLSEQAETTRKNFIGSETLLDSLNVNRNARMLVIDAWSTNIPLIQMRRMGYTLLSTRRDVLEKAMQWEWDYVVVQDLYFPSEVVSAYPEILARLRRVGGNGRISVFSKNISDQKMTLAESLGIEKVQKICFFDFATSDNDSGWRYERLDEQQFISQPRAGLLLPEDEFGPTCTLSASVEGHSRTFDKILFEGSYFSEKPQKTISAIATLERDGRLDFYGGYAFSTGDSAQWRQFHALFYLPDSVTTNQTLKCYLWNPEKTRLYLDDFKVTLY